MSFLGFGSVKGEHLSLRRYHGFPAHQGGCDYE